MNGGPVWPVLPMYSMACLSSNFVKMKGSRCLFTTFFLSMSTGDWRSPPQEECGRRCQWDGLISEGGWEEHEGFFFFLKKKHLYPARANSRPICFHATYHSDHRSTTQGLGNKAQLKCQLSCVSFPLPHHDDTHLIGLCWPLSYSLEGNSVDGEAKTWRLLSFCVGR